MAPRRGRQRSFGPARGTCLSTEPRDGACCPPRRPTVARVDDDLAAVARRRGGFVRPDELGGLSRARRRGLVVAQPGVLVAETQPLGARDVVRAVRLSVRGDYWFAGRAALWIHGAGSEPTVVDVAVRDVRQIVLAPPVRVRRLAPSLLTSTRTVSGLPVVSLETAVVQSAEQPDDLLDVVEDVLRRRATTPARLRSTCRRGVAGSAALRAVLDVVSDGDLEELKRRLRAALVGAGVRGLRSEVAVRSASGAVAYLDLYDDVTRNAVELDGWASHTERARFRADRRRDRWVRSEHGILTTRVAADEVRDDVVAVAAELAPLFLRRSA